jgi:hypothetical protein
MHPRARRTVEWVELAVLALTALLVLARLALEIRDGVDSPWSGARLAFSAGVVRGIDVYPTAHAGVVTGNMYGPAVAVFYLPALLAPSVTGKLVAGMLLSALAMLMPAAILLASVRRELDIGVRGLARGLVLLLALLLVMPSTSYQLGSIHADAPCLGFGLASLLAFGRVRSPAASRLIAAAILAALATLSKPHGLFVGVAEVLLLAFRVGVGRAAAYAALFATLTLALLWGLTLATGSTLAGVWYNDVVIPSMQQLALNPRSVVRGMGKLMLPMLGFAAATVLAVRLGKGSAAVRDLRAWPPLVLELWFFALVLVPISYLGRAKVGGDVNSFHAHYFAIVGTVVAWVAALSRVSMPGASAVALAALGYGIWPFGRGLPLESWSANAHERIHAYLARDPKAFFPWHSLATLEATGRYFHHPDGLHSRKLSGVPLTQGEFMAHAPARPSLIAMPRQGPRMPTEFVFAELVERYYPDYEAVPARAPELWAWGLQVFAPRAEAPIAGADVRARRAD